MKKRVCKSNLVYDYSFKDVLFPIIKNRFVHAKVFIMRSLGYLNIINSFILVFLLISQLKDYGLNINIKYWSIPIFLIIMGFMILFGWFEDKLGFFAEENSIINERQLYINEIFKKLDSIEKRVKK